MRDNDRQKNGRLKLHRGGQYGRRAVHVRTGAELELDDRMRAAFARCQSERGTVPSRAVQEIREGRQTPWRNNARRAIEMLDAGVPVTAIKAAVALEMAQWVDDLAARRSGRPDPDPVSAALNLRKAA